MTFPNGFDQEKKEEENYVGSEALPTSTKEKESPRALAPYDSSTSRESRPSLSR